MLEGDARGHAAACGAAVHLALGEDADVRCGRGIEGILAVGQDGAVEEGQVRIVGMVEPDLGLGCL